MSFEKNYEGLTDEQKKQLLPFVSDCESYVFVLKNLPEVIKGALFSRYSRSYLGLRTLLLKEFLQSNDSGLTPNNLQQSLVQDAAVNKAHEFYDRILDGYGDDSIGELGGAHLAIENVTMLAAKHIQDCRIGGSPLEKSTRYICFDRKIDGLYAFHREKTLMQSIWGPLYEKTCNLLFDTYAQLIPPLTEYIQENFPKEPTITEHAYQAALRAKVLDCLRGLLPAGTLTNLGVFGNGRFFEKLLTDLRLSGLEELQAISQEAFFQINQVMPSFIRRASPSNRHWPATQEYKNALKDELTKLSIKKKNSSKPAFQAIANVKLLDSDSQNVERVARALAFEVSDISLNDLKISPENIFKKLGEIRTNRRHKLPRALEHAFYTFEIEGDFGVYRDLQRHRMLSQERQLLGCELGYVLPKEIVDAGLEKPFCEALHAAKSAYDQISREFPSQAQYIVPMAYRIRWYYHINLRSLQWLCELRSSPAGHSQYRYIAQEMTRLVCKRDPLFAPLFKFVDFDGHTLGRIQQEQRKATKRA